MAFAKSRPKVYEKDERRVTFEDVAGNEEAVIELREVVEFLWTPEKYEAVGGRIPKGFSWQVRRARARRSWPRPWPERAGVPFFSLSGSDFVEMFVGVGAAGSQPISAGRGQGPMPHRFIDELDAARARHAGPAAGTTTNATRP